MESRWRELVSNRSGSEMAVVLELLAGCAMISGAGEQTSLGNPAVGDLSSTKD